MRELKKYIQDLIPIVQKHLDEAQNIENSLDQSGNRRPGCPSTPGVTPRHGIRALPDDPRSGSVSDKLKSILLQGAR